MADIFNIPFQSVFNTNELVDNTIPGVFPSCTNAENQPSNIQLTPPEVENALNTIDPNKSPGPDKIPGRLLKELAPQIACSLCRLFNLSVVIDRPYGAGGDVTGSDVIPHFPIGLRRFSLIPEVTSPEVTSYHTFP